MNPIKKRSQLLPLGALLGLWWVVGSFYAVYTPRWQAPDEPAHYNYVAQVAQMGCCPIIEMGDWDSAYLEQLKASRFAPDQTDQLGRVQYEDHQPPLYYLLQVVGFRRSGGNLIALRLTSLVIGSGMVWATLAIARMLLPTRPSVGWVAGLLVALIPQHLAIVASINNDALALTLIALTLWVGGAYLLAPSPNLIGWHVALGGLLGLAFLTKTTAYFLLGVVVLLLPVRVLIHASTSTSGKLFGEGAKVLGALGKLPIPLMGTETAQPSLRWWVRLWVNFTRSFVKVYAPSLRRSRQHLLRAYALTLALALGLGAVWWIRNSMVYGGGDIVGLRAHDAVVVGQLRTADYLAQVGQAHYWQALLQTTFHSFWGQLGWMGLPLPAPFYTLLSVLVGLASLGTVLDIAWQVRRRHTPSAFQWGYGVVLGAVALASVAQYAYYNLSFVQFQGRYLFPALIPFSLWMGNGLVTWGRLLEHGLRRWLGKWAVVGAYAVPLGVLMIFAYFNQTIIRYLLPYLAP